MAISLFGRLGNKTNDIKYFEPFIPKDINEVIEPFGGTFALIRKIYADKDGELINKNIKLYVNDTDTTLFKIYKNPRKYAELKIHFRKIAEDYIYDEKNHVHIEQFKNRLAEETFDEEETELFNHIKENQIMRGIFKQSKSTNWHGMINLMDKIEFTCEDYLKVIERHANNPKAFIFLDPPYIFSNNTHYSNQKNGTDGCDNTDMLYKILDVMQTSEAKIMLVINNLKIIKWIFKDFPIIEYQKTYSFARKKETHLVIINYEIDDF